MTKIKIAIFAQYGNCIGDKVPEGCPEEYGDKDKRHLLAKWLEKNADNEGPYIVTQWESGSTTYEYLSQNDKSKKYAREPEERLTRVAVVNVDASRPWMILGIRGEKENYWESIYYLDKTDEQNRVIPEYFREEIGHYRYGEEAERENIILDKRYGENPVSISLVAGGDNRKRFRSAKTVEEAMELFREFANKGIEVDTFFLSQESDWDGNLPDGGPNCFKMLAWLEECLSIDPDFKLPRKIEARGGRLNFNFCNILAKMYGWDNVGSDRLRGVVRAVRKETDVGNPDKRHCLKVNFKTVAGNTLQIITDGKYEVKGREVRLPREHLYSRVMVYSPYDAKHLLSSEGIKYFKRETMCRISFVKEDAFRAASRLETPMVLSFAHAGCPGGGFRGGELTQEESLCCCSTLFASLASDRASEMYEYNGENPIDNYSDYMLFSPYVVVFRDIEKGLLEEPFVVAVASVPAPNACFKSNDIIDKTLRARIRRMLGWAMMHRHKNVVLGAWGCGGCHNDPHHVAYYFKKVLVENGFGYCFDEVCFAFYGNHSNQNKAAFEDVFEKEK